MKKLLFCCSIALCCLLLLCNVVSAQAVARLVVLPADALECVRLLGGMSSVVGVSQHTLTRTDFFPEAAQLPSVGRGFTPNLEAIALLQPTVVVAWEGRPGPELERQLEPLGIQVVRLDMHLPHKLEAGVNTLAQLLGGDAPQKAAAFIQWHDHHEERLRALWQKQAQKKGLRPTVLAEHFSQERLAGPGSALYALTEKAGGKNLAAGLRLPSSSVNAEWIVAQNPQVLIKSLSLNSLETAAGLVQLAQAREELFTRSGWKDVDAVRERRVHVLASDVLGGLRWVVGMAALVGYFYPEVAFEADAKALHEEYLRLFQQGSAGGPFASP